MQRFSQAGITDAFASGGHYEEDASSLGPSAAVAAAISGVGNAGVIGDGANDDWQTESEVTEEWVSDTRRSERY